MSVKGDLQGLHPSAVIELFIVDLTRYTNQVLHFHAGTNKLGGDVIWQGVTYVRYPVRATGFEWKGQGTLPRPHFAVANVTGIVSAMCHLYSDLVGCPVTRKRTLARYLDAANYPDGNPFANPDEAFSDDIFAINQKTRESVDIVEFELATPLDVEGVLLPRRQVVANACPWRYRGDGCGYAGPPVADINDNPTSDPSADVCGKRLKSCKMRFGSGWLPFGGFPGAGQYRT
ncbi:phage minor tail protein L [Caballeronia sp. LP003]|uniref:phage minor tail protein L n=1 Tax=Caballeronia sp. LP003 TaxID=3038551 RepID=UPI00285C7F20|nr:phage minor tail protein L [Caballeronia sp. LP003]MDR5790275.1 phage minor tail protein L [Caballeronia sp. LP003]